MLLAWFALAAPVWWNIGHPGADLNGGKLDYYDILPRIHANMARLQLSWGDVERKAPGPGLRCGPDEERAGPDSRGFYHCYAWDGAEPNEAGLDTQLRALKRLGIDTVVLVDPMVIIDYDGPENGQCPAWRCSVIPNLKYAYTLEPEQRENWLFFLDRLVKRFKAQNRHWSAWNEIDFPDDRAAAMPYLDGVVALVRDTMKTIKAADPQAVTVMGGLSKPREKPPLFFRRLFEQADRFIDIYDVHHYPAGSTQESVSKDLVEHARLWNWMTAYGAGPKMRWMTEMGGPKSDGNKTDEDYARHDFLVAKNWLKYCLWLLETGRKPSRPERLFWFRLADKTARDRRTNKYNGFVWRSASWRDDKPRDFERKQFFIDSAAFWVNEIGSFRRIEALRAPDGPLHLFRVTGEKGNTFWIAWNEGAEPLDLPALPGAKRVRRAVVARGSGLRDTVFRVEPYSGKSLAPEASPREGNIYLID